MYPDYHEAYYWKPKLLLCRHRLTITYCQISTTNAPKSYKGTGELCTKISVQLSLITFFDTAFLFHFEIIIEVFKQNVLVLIQIAYFIKEKDA